jgi:hypothetical protein
MVDISSSVDEYLDYRKNGLAYLYVIKCGPCYKIGITRNMKDRMEAIALHNPFKLKAILYRTIVGRHVRFVEKTMHELLAHQNHRGEWFETSVPEIKRALKEAMNRMRRRETEYQREQRASALRLKISA